MLQPTLTLPELKALKIREYITDRGGKITPVGARFISSLLPHDPFSRPGFVHYETLCERMERLGYPYTSTTELRNYARHAKNGLRTVPGTAEIANANSMGYRIEVLNPEFTSYLKLATVERTGEDDASNP